jgi:hypothetical protein
MLSAERRALATAARAEAVLLARAYATTAPSDSDTGDGISNVNVENVNTEAKARAPPTATPVAVKDAYASTRGEGAKDAIPSLLQVSGDGAMATPAEGSVNRGVAIDEHTSSAVDVNASAPSGSNTVAPDSPADAMDVSELLPRDAIESVNGEEEVVRGTAQQDATESGADHSHGQGPYTAVVTGSLSVTDGNDGNKNNDGTRISATAVSELVSAVIVTPNHSDSTTFGAVGGAQSRTDDGAAIGVAVPDELVSVEQLDSSAEQVNSAAATVGNIVDGNDASTIVDGTAPAVHSAALSRPLVGVDVVVTSALEGTFQHLRTTPCLSPCLF